MCAWRCTGVLLCARAQKRTKSNRNVCDLHVRLQPILHLDTQVEPRVLNKAPILRLHLSEKGTALILAPTLPNSVFGRTSVQVSLHFITRGTNEPHRYFWGAHSLVTTCVYTSVKTCIWIEICPKMYASSKRGGSVKVGRGDARSGGSRSANLACGEPSPTLFPLLPSPPPPPPALLRFPALVLPPLPPPSPPSRPPSPSPNENGCFESVTRPPGLGPSSEGAA